MGRFGEADRGIDGDPDNRGMIAFMGTTSYIVVSCKFCKGVIPLQEIHPDFRFLPFPKEEFTAIHRDQECELEFTYNLRDVGRKLVEPIPDFEANPNFPRMDLETIYGQGV